MEEVRVAREAARQLRVALGRAREEASGRATLAANHAEEAVREAEDRMLRHVHQETARFFAREVLAREMLRMKGEVEELRRRCTELEEDLTGLEGDNTRLVEDNIKLVENNTRLEEDNTRLEENNTRLEEDLTGLLENNSRLEEVNARLVEDKIKMVENNTRLEENNTRLEEDLMGIVEENSRMEEINTRLEEENAMLVEDNAMLVQDHQQLANEIQNVRQQKEELEKNELKRILENVDRTNSYVKTEQVFDGMKGEECTKKSSRRVEEGIEAAAEVDDVQVQDMDLEELEGELPEEQEELEEELAATSPQQSEELSSTWASPCAWGEGCRFLAAGTCKFFHPGVGVQQLRHRRTKGGQGAVTGYGTRQGGADFLNFEEKLETAQMTDEEKRQLVVAVGMLPGDRRGRAIQIIQQAEPGFMKSNFEDIKQNFETIQQSTLRDLKAFVIQSKGGKALLRKAYRRPPIYGKGNMGVKKKNKITKRSQGYSTLLEEEMAPKKRQQKEQQKLRKKERRSGKTGPGLCWAWNQGDCGRSLCRFEHRCSVVSGEVCREAHRAGEHF